MPKPNIREEKEKQEGRSRMKEIEKEKKKEDEEERESCDKYFFFIVREAFCSIPAIS